MYYKKVCTSDQISNVIHQLSQIAIPVILRYKDLNKPASLTKCESLEDIYTKIKHRYNSMISKEVERITKFLIKGGGNSIKPLYMRIMHALLGKEEGTKAYLKLAKRLSNNI